MYWALQITQKCIFSLPRLNQMDKSAHLIVQDVKCLYVTSIFTVFTEKALLQTLNYQPIKHFHVWLSDIHSKSSPFLLTNYILLTSLLLIVILKDLRVIQVMTKKEKFPLLILKFSWHIYRSVVSGTIWSNCSSIYCLKTKLDKWAVAFCIHEKVFT